MNATIENLVNELHRSTENLLRWSFRLGMMTLSVGALFVAMCVWVVNFLASPLPFLEVQEISRQGVEMAMRSQTVEDNSWDGAFSGFCLGLSFSGAMPVVGPVVAPLVGAVIGYKVDERV